MSRRIRSRIAIVLSLAFLLSVNAGPASGHPLVDDWHENQHLLKPWGDYYRGNVNSAWQTILWADGYLCLIDGVYGDGTGTGTRNFQSWHNLSVDGVAGPESWGHAMGHLEYSFTDRASGAFVYEYEGRSRGWTFWYLNDDRSWYFPVPGTGSSHVHDTKHPGITHEAGTPC